MATNPGVHVHIHFEPGGALKAGAERARSTSAAAASGKERKGDVDYRDASGGKRCGNCIHGNFDAGEEAGVCALVAGVIGKNMVCDLYESKLDRTAKAAIIERATQPETSRKKR